MFKQEKAEEKGRYKTAKSCKHKLSRIKEALLSQKIKELEETHLEEKARIRQAHKEEMNKIDSAWSKMIRSYDRRIQQMVERWEDKKEQDLSRLDFEIEKLSEGGLKLRSKSLKQLQKAKRYYLEAENYEQARLIDMEIDERTEQLLKKSEADFNRKCANLQEALDCRHEKEESALYERIKRARREQAIHCSAQKKR